jgi:hypothetical protein
MSPGAVRSLPTPSAIAPARSHALTSLRGMPRVGMDPRVRSDGEQRLEIAHATDVSGKQLGHAAGCGVEDFGRCEAAFDEGDAGAVKDGARVGHEARADAEICADLDRLLGLLGGGDGSDADSQVAMQEAQGFGEDRPAAKLSW